jgi:ketosteroid isomerase-like protein
MRKFFVATLLALLASSFAVAQTSNTESAGPTQSQLEAELLKAGRALEAAFAKQDSDALALLLADEFITTDEEGTVHNKAQEIASMKSSSAKVEITDDPAEAHTRIYGLTAVETGKFIAKGTNKGRPFTKIGRYTTTWVWRDARWQIVADHVSEIDE